MSLSKKSSPVHEQEMEGSARLGHGDDASDGEDVDELALWKRVRAGNSNAIEKLVKRHERVASSIAAAHKGRGLDADTLLDEAVQALRLAISKFDAKRSKDFRPFATSVVRNHLADLFRQSSLLSPHERQQAGRFEASRSSLSHELRREPTDDEVYERLGWSETQCRNHEFSKQRAIKRTESLDQPGIDLPADRNAVDPTCRLRIEEQSQKLDEGLRQLNSISRRVITERFLGIDCPSQKDTAQRLGISEYAERQIEEEALSHLRKCLDGTEVGSQLAKPLSLESTKEPNL